jgi:DNA-binding NarL/FixJ family response regulator
VNENDRPSRHGNLRILLVDDHAFFHVGVSSFLEHVDGFEVVGAARDPRETFDILEREPVDFALVDISLGRADGLELVKQILPRWPQVRVIMLSMHAERNYAERALRAGARGYVMKSEPPEVLVDAIHRIERGGVYLSERLQSEIAHRFFQHDAAEAGSPVERLTDRELSVFRMLGEGRTSREIAESLHVGFKTVQTYRERIKTKLGIGSANELVQQAVLHVQAEAAEQPHPELRSPEPGEKEGEQ